MFPLEDGLHLQGGHVPHVYCGVPPYLSCGRQVQGGVWHQTQDVISVGGVEGLTVGGLVIHHTHCRYVVEDVTLLGVVEVLTTVISTIPEL